MPVNKGSTTTPAPSPGWATRRAPSIICAPRSNWTASSPRTRVRTTTSSRCAAAPGSSRSRLPGSSALEVQIELELQSFRIDPGPPRRRLQPRQGKGHLHRVADVRPGFLRREGRTLQHQRQPLGDGLEVEAGFGCAGHGGTKMEVQRNFCILPRMTLALALLLAASSAAAAVPEKGEGTITLLGGTRALFPGNGDYLTEQGASHQVLQPGGLVSFGYQYDDDLQVKTIPIMLALDTLLVRGQSVTFYGAGGIGYSLNTGTRQGISNEANSTAAYLALGLRFQVAGPVAIVLEDRYTLSNAQVDAQSQRKLTVGGNLLSLGLMFHFLEPDDKGKPTGL